MQKALLLKTLIVIGLMLAIGVPLMMIQSTIAERTRFREEAVQSISADSVREQMLVGPLLILPYTESYDEEQVIDAASKQTKLINRIFNRRLVVFPNELQIQGEIDTYNRHRGIRKVLAYSAQHVISGNFILPKTDIQHEKPGSVITPGKPFIALGVNDVRGIHDIPKINWNGRQVEFQQGSNLASFRSGLHAPLEPADISVPGPVKFTFQLGLDGIERLKFVPVAKNNQVTLRSKWPHPQFNGRFLPLPNARKIDKNGFDAVWNISALATNTQQQLLCIEQSLKAGDSVASEKLDDFGVALVEPINIYSQADKAIKYGLLFVGLTFAAFFLFELLKQLPIHPVQYTLIELALALFFLLLVSLSEHMQFIHAYATASGACVALIGFYLTHVLRNWMRGFGFGIGLTVLYGVLYGLLNSETNALVMGSLLLFAILSAIMIVTRKIDWYQVGRSDLAVREA